MRVIYKKRWAIDIQRSLESAVGVVEVVEGMEEDLLGLLLADDELDVVYEKYLYVPVLGAVAQLCPMAWRRWVLPRPTPE